MQFLPRDTGWIEVICGSMFSGKTEELIRRIRRAEIARQRVVLFKPETDNRYDATDVVSHSRQRLPSIAVARAEEILEHLADPADVVGVDEAQFFEMELLGVCRTLAVRGVRVIVAGLEQDYRMRPFPVMAALLVEAESVTKNLAICVTCGNPALRNQRLDAREGQIAVGGDEAYEARCRRCFELPGEDAELFTASSGEPA